MGAADGWFFSGKKSVGYHLVEQGFDVWLGNNRGNKYTRPISSERAKNGNFYDFSFEEMGVIDMPATYRYILDNPFSKRIQNEKIIFIGFSQGNTVGFAGLLDEKS